VFANVLAVDDVARGIALAADELDAGLIVVGSAQQIRTRRARDRQCLARAAPHVATASLGGAFELIARPCGPAGRDIWPCASARRLSTVAA
jgi:hypothetical protein